MATIFHITTRAKWLLSAASGQYIDESLRSEGFIHCSTPEQVVGVANTKFRGRDGLVLLCIDTGEVRSAIRYESPESGGEKYPHIYGPINHDAVKEVIDLVPSPDGTFALPEALMA